MQRENCYEFKVTIEGVALPAETVTRINEALQKAALAEMAPLDLRGKEVALSPIMARMDNGGGGFRVIVRAE